MSETIGESPLLERTITQELGPEFLKSVFTSRVFSERMWTLYKQYKMGKTLFSYQRFSVYKIDDEKIYVSPLTAIKEQLEKPPIHSAVFDSLKRFLADFRLATIPQASLIISAHTHPWFFASPRVTGREPMIGPSAFEEPNKGDLYCLLVWSRHQTPSVAIRRPLMMVITQELHPQIPIEFLLIQESEKLQATDENEVIKRLKEAQETLFRDAKTQQEIIEILQQMQYRVALFTLPEERFTGPHLFSDEDLAKISQFAY
jgi:hypothetical protein